MAGLEGESKYPKESEFALIDALQMPDVMIFSLSEAGAGRQLTIFR